MKTHTHIYTHTLDLYIFSVANAHNLHFSVALHFALNLTRSISSANINSHFCCRPDAHTYRHAHTDCVSDLSLRHLLEVFVQILSLTLKWNVNVAPVKALCLPRCRFYPLQILNILPSVPPPLPIKLLRPPVDTPDSLCGWIIFLPLGLLGVQQDIQGPKQMFYNYTSSRRQAINTPFTPFLHQGALVVSKAAL